jgi:DNA processing protein
MSERDYWVLWNQLHRFVGPVKFKQILAAFGSAEKAWKSPPEKFAKLGWGEKTLKALKRRKNLSLEPILRNLDRLGARVITIEDSNYPGNLRSIYDPPPLIYVRGSFSGRDDLSLAVVGARRMTRYGVGVVEALVPELCGAGLTIVSGLALGVDAASQKMALESGGRTIAVLACGIDQIYPPSNQRLGEELLESGRGVIMTELPLGTPTYPANFPVRNRIISGIALGTLVIEAAEKSGTFHTVRAALEQGREVFAVPGSIFSPFSAGTAALIKLGATPVSKVGDILEELEVEAAVKKRTFFESNQLSKSEESLLEVVGEEEEHIDEIIKESGEAAEKVLSGLTLLEMKGLVKSAGGGFYRRAV